MRYFYRCTLIFLVASCSLFEREDRHFEYDYTISTYHGDTLDPKNLSQVEFYDSAGRLVRVVDAGGGCTTFIYNNEGLLLEKRRSRDCIGGGRELMIYDRSGNLLGSYWTTAPQVNLDTVKYKQRYFYDNENHLVRKLEREWNDGDRANSEEWTVYLYDNGRVIGDTIKVNEGVSWIGSYHYDTAGRLNSINRIRGSVYRTETFKYDSSGFLVESAIDSNERFLFDLGDGRPTELDTSKVTFHRGKNRTLYRYNADGRLAEKKILSHRGKVHSRTIYVKSKRSASS